MEPKGQKIHTRKIDIATYAGTFDSIIVEGILRDERLLDTYRPTGEIYPPGTIHHMIIRIEVKGPKLIIEDIVVEMPTIPHDACVETLNCLEPVKGMPIVSGFTAKVKDLVGGVKGCCHLLALLTAMAPAAVQGAWSAMAREPIDPELYMPMALGRVKNTCWVWREDGRLMQEWSAKANGKPHHTDTEEIRQRFMPDNVRLLLVGESPPAAGKFFYVKSNMTTYTSRAFEKAHRITFKDNAGFLKYFMECYCYLDDLCHTPVDDLSTKQREQRLKGCIVEFSERIRQVNPPVVVVVLKKIEGYVREAISLSGCHPKIYILPFPGNGHQNKYVEQLSEIIMHNLNKQSFIQNVIS